MNIHEYQAKQILKKFGAPVPNGVAILNLSEIESKTKGLKTNCFWFLHTLFEKFFHRFLVHIECKMYYYY